MRTISQHLVRELRDIYMQTWATLHMHSLHRQTPVRELPASYDRRDNTLPLRRRETWRKEREQRSTCINEELRGTKTGHSVFMNPLYSQLYSAGQTLSFQICHIKVVCIQGDVVDSSLTWGRWQRLYEHCSAGSIWGSLWRCDHLAPLSALHPETPRCHRRRQCSAPAHRPTGQRRADRTGGHPRPLPAPGPEGHSST